MFKSILKMVKSMSEKKYTDVTGTEAQELIKSKSNLQILDVRTASEIQGGKIPRSKHADVMSPQFKNSLKGIDLSNPLLVYCRSGNRSKMACSLLHSLGATEIYNLLGGYPSYTSTAKGK